MTVFFEKVEFDRYESGLRVDAVNQIKEGVCDIALSLDGDKSCWRLTITNDLIIGEMVQGTALEPTLMFASSEFSLLTHNYQAK